MRAARTDGTHAVGGPSPGIAVLCATPTRLACVQASSVSYSFVPSAPPVGAIRAFTHLEGGVFDLPTMDARCMSDATAAVLPGTYVAFIGASPGTPALSRTTASGPVYRSARRSGVATGPLVVTRSSEVRGGDTSAREPVSLRA